MTVDIVFFNQTVEVVQDQWVEGPGRGRGRRVIPPVRTSPPSPGGHRTGSSLLCTQVLRVQVDRGPGRPSCAHKSSESRWTEDRVVPPVYTSPPSAVGQRTGSSLLCKRILRVQMDGGRGTRTVTLK